mgnify:CR=1 FL=1
MCLPKIYEPEAKISRTAKSEEKVFKEIFALALAKAGNITETEIAHCCKIAKLTNIELVLQPKMIDNKMSITSDFCNSLLDKFTTMYPNCRLIPQVHKFLDVR